MSRYVHPSLFDDIKGAPPPGLFRAKCHLPRWVEIDELAEINPDTTRNRWDSNRECSVFKVHCDFETADGAALVEHMREAHGARLDHGLEREIKAIRRMWKPPRLTEDGKPFEPTDFGPGAEITWRERVPTGQTYYDELHRTIPKHEYIWRAGCIWSAAPGPESAWVVPYQPFRGEVAVCVRQYRDGLEANETWTTELKSAVA